jgi:hypothetical protein
VKFNFVEEEFQRILVPQYKNPYKNELQTSIDLNRIAG